MNTLLGIIGGIVFSIVMYSVPILTTCSIALNWDGTISFGLIALSLIQLYVLTVLVINKAEEGE